MSHSSSSGSGGKINLPIKKILTGVLVLTATLLIRSVCKAQEFSPSEGGALATAITGAGAAAANTVIQLSSYGKVSACRILYRTNPDEFADLSCKLLMQRAKMAPALDAQGKPVRSFYISQIRWQAGEW